MPALTRVRLAIVGFGRLGRACVAAAREHGDVELAGVVRRPEAARMLPPPFDQVPVAGHVRELDRVDAVLLCVPLADTEAIARELLQQRYAVVECATIDPEHHEAYQDRLADFALRHRARVMTGAGWEPGVLTILTAAFEMLIPRGHTQFARHPAASLHHTAAAEGIGGVKGALAVEYPGPDGARQRYVYVELESGARLQDVSAALCADPVFAGAPTQVMAVESLAALDQGAHGVLLERLGTGTGGAHPSLLLEGRGDPVALAARVMVDGGRRLPGLMAGGHRYRLTL